MSLNKKIVITFGLIVFAIAVMVGSGYLYIDIKKYYERKNSEILHYAAQSGDLITVTAVLNEYPQLLDSLDSDKRTPLHLASSGGEVSVVLYLLKSGANFTIRDKYERTARDYAAISGHHDIARVLQDAIGYQNGGRP